MVNPDQKLYMTDELLPIKKSRIKPKAGDVFVIQPRKDVYFFCKVIRTNLSAVNQLDKGFIDNMNLIYIYKTKTKELIMPERLDIGDLMMPPQIVNFRGWTMGYFFTIGNMAVSKEEKGLRYGLWDDRFGRGKYVDAEGRKLKTRPSLFSKEHGVYALGSYGSVAYCVDQILKAHPSMLIF